MVSAEMLGWVNTRLYELFDCTSVVFGVLRNSSCPVDGQKVEITLGGYFTFLN